MKEPEYIEGPKAFENFEQGMKALFKVSKAAIVQAEKEKRKPAEWLGLTPSRRTS